MDELEKQKLIIRDSSEFYVLGLTTAKTLEYTTSIFLDANPENHELAVIDLSEKTSDLPLDEKTAKEYIADTYKIDELKLEEVLTASEQIGFIDDSGHRTRGNFTDGVGRQYIGEIGKTDNRIRHGNEILVNFLRLFFQT